MEVSYNYGLSMPVHQPSHPVPLLASLSQQYQGHAFGLGQQAMSSTTVSPFLSSTTSASSMFAPFNTVVATASVPSPFFTAPVTHSPFAPIVSAYPTEQPMNMKVRNRTCFEASRTAGCGTSQTTGLGASTADQSCNLARYASPTKKSRQMMDIGDDSQQQTQYQQPQQPQQPQRHPSALVKRKRSAEEPPMATRLNTFRTNNVEQHTPQPQQSSQTQQAATETQASDPKYRKTEHKAPAVRDMSPQVRGVKVRFGADLKTTVEAKILYKEPWGVMVQMLEDNEEFGVTKGRKWWAKYSGNVNGMQCVPILDAVHPSS